MRLFRRFVTALSVALAARGVAFETAHAVELTVSAVVSGATPEIVGYNSGHFMPGSNTSAWWRYSGVNGARVWPTPNVVEGTDDSGGWGDGVSSEATFLARRTALRGDPLNFQYINWPYLNGRYQNNPTSGSNIINLHHAFSKLNQMGINSVVEIHRSVAGYPFAAAGTETGWADRWEHWQHFYAQAFYLAKNFNVHRFQMYNEPDLDEMLTVDEYLERLRFASDAVQSAVADVNRMFGKSLDAEMQAPVSAGGTADYSTWGQPVLADLHDTIDPAFRLIDTYAYQQYNLSGESFGSQLASIKSSVNGDAPGEGLRFAITEFNVHTASAFDNIPETLDTPAKSARFGSILANLANNQPDELYIFKLSQGPGDGDSGVKKNGTHFVDNDNAPYNIGGVTKGGEVVRLFAKGFAGANQLFNVPAASGSGATDVRLAASHNVEKDQYYLLAANEATDARPLAINLVAWGIQPGTRVIVEEVSADRHGEVSQLLTVPQNGLLNVTQAAQSVLLFSIPKFKSANYVTLNATEDAHVQSGANAPANFGNAVDLFAKNDPSNPAARSVSFVKFNTGSIVTSEIEQAVLQVHGANAGSASQVIAHVYGLTNDAWNEATINWNNAPNLKDSLGTAVDDISENFIEDVGTSASIVGHFTGIAGAGTMSIDVTNFVNEHPNQEVTFLIAREVRFDGENVNDALTSLQFASTERGANPGPQLLLSLSGRALTGDYDHDGAVDAADYVVWQRDFGMTGDLAADGDRSGKVDGGDYLVWRKNFGASLPGVVGGGGMAIPEPTTVVIVAIGSLPLALLCGARR